jgi:hypothetical protein
VSSLGNKCMFKHLRQIDASKGHSDVPRNSSRCAEHRKLSIVGPNFLFYSCESVAKTSPIFAFHVIQNMNTA